MTLSLLNAVFENFLAMLLQFRWSCFIVICSLFGSDCIRLVKRHKKETLYVTKLKL